MVDTLANAAFYYGLIRVLADDEQPVWSRMSFSAAEENFHTAAREGIEAAVYWPGVGEVPAAELVLRRLLPLAYEGLDRWDSTRATATACWASSSAGARPCATAPRGKARPFAGSPATADSTGPRRCAG